MGAMEKLDISIGLDVFTAMCARREKCPELRALRIEACTFSEGERKAADKLGTRYAAFTEASVTANFLAFMSLTVPALGERAIVRGDEIIVVATDVPPALSAMEQFGVCPIFVKPPYPQGCIDESVLECALSMQTKAVLLSHTKEMIFDLKTVRNFCNKYDLWLIEDSLEAYGATYNFDGVVYYTGTVGDVGTVSFPGTAGGAMLTNNETLCAIAHVLRGCGNGAF